MTDRTRALITLIVWAFWPKLLDRAIDRHEEQQRQDGVVIVKPPKGWKR